MGIDFGTANSRIAIVKDGQVTVVPDTDGGNVIPSVASFGPDGLVVGRRALRMAATHPGSTIRGVKRLLGLPRAHPLVDAVAGSGALVVDEDASGQLLLPVAGAVLSPTAVATGIFAHLQQLTVPMLGGWPSSVVVAAPTWFDEDQRDALIDAARAAGMPIRRVISEPAALSLALASRNQPDHLVMIVDVGAGGCSASIVDVSPRSVHLRASAGQGTLGGEEIDRALVWQALTSLGAIGEVLGKPSMLELFRRVCEVLKQDLSTQAVSSRPAPLLGQGAPPTCRLDRAALDTVVADLLKSVAEATAEALDVADVLPEAVRSVYLTGGMSKVASVRACVEHIFGARLVRGGDLEGYIAIGAALASGGLSGELEEVFIEEGVYTCWVDQPSVAPPGPPPERPTEPAGVERPSLEVEVDQSWRADEVAAAGEGSIDIELDVDIDVDVEHAPPASAPPAGRVALSKVIAGGEIKNPATPTELLDLPVVGRRLHPADVDPIALPVLLTRIMAERDINGTLTLEMGAKPIVVNIKDGRAYLGQGEKAALLDAFKEAGGAYRFEKGEPDVSKGTRTGMIRLTVEGLRSFGRAFGAEDFSAALGDRLERTPVVPEEVVRTLPALGLKRNEDRLVQYGFDGKRSAKIIAERGGMPPRSAYSLMVLLTVFNCVDWTEVEDDGGQSLVDKVKRIADEMERANHFEAVEVHWSAPISEIEQAYERVLERFRPGTNWFAITPEQCERITARAHEAWAVLSNPVTRQSHQQEVSGDVDVKGLTDMVSGRIDSLELRGDESEASKAKKDLDAIRRSLSGSVPASE